MLKVVFGIANPIKKSVIKTQCRVHKLINLESLEILLNDKYYEEYALFSKYIPFINEGAVWADQDFKSSNHFYNPYNEKGLYGRESAMDLCLDYYSKAINLWGEGQHDKSFFYLGAVLHLIQDMTIPQHANIRLLDNHRQYEKYIKSTYEYTDQFKVKNGAYILYGIEKYIRFNARAAIKIYKHFRYINDDEIRFYKIAKCALPLSKRTTAGAMVTFYKDVIH